MLPAFILWLLKKYHLAAKVKLYAGGFFKLFLHYFKKRIAALLLFFLLTLCLKAQKMQYAILKGGDTVGVLNYSRNIVANTVLYKAETNVKVWFIFSVSVNSKEESCFKDGVLQYSSVYRKVNGNIKVNYHTRLNGNTYIIEDKKEDEVEEFNSYPITGSFLSLYYNEPANNTAVYSDSFKKIITIIKLEEHKYKVTMPDGNYNYYYYHNGVCNRVEIVRSFYKLTFCLITNS